MTTKTRNIIIWVLLAVLMLGMIGTAAKVNELDTTAEVSWMMYRVGALDEEGEFEETDIAIYTKDMIPVDGLVCEIAKKADIEYKVYFYDEDKDFLSASVMLTTDLIATEIPADAEYCRIVITPLDGDEVSIFDIRTLAADLAVSYNR